MESRNLLSKEQVRKLPYLRAIANDGRIVPLQTFFEPIACDWHLYLPVKPGELGRLAGGEPISGSYISSVAADPAADFELKLGTLLMQHVSYVEVLRPFGKLENDIHRCGAVLEKYQILWTTRAAHTRSAPLLIQSELEYLLFLLRALYDVLQAIVQAIAARLVVLDGSAERALKNLPNSFRQVVLTDGKLSSVDEIQLRWKMPRSLAEWYWEQAGFFRLLRSLRDGIAHHGANPPTVFEMEWGFAIAPDAAPWKEVEALLSGERWSGRLSSLRALFVEFVLRAIHATEELAETLVSFVQLPAPILGDVRLFLRSPFGSWLVSLEKIRQQPWEGRG